MIHDAFDKQTAINMSIENGVLNIDNLLACNDFETIKEGLNNYPLTINEYLKNKYTQGDLRTIFEWSIDNNATRISDFIINGKMPSLGYRSRNTTFDDLIDYEIAELKGKGKKFINDKYFYTKSYGYSYSSRHIEPDKTKEQDEVIISRVAELADQKGISMTEIALAWLLTKVTAPVVGATKFHHIEGAAKAVEVALSEAEIAYLEEAYVPHSLVGVMAQNSAKPRQEKPVWSVGDQTFERKE